MKKILLSLALVFCCLASVSAQMLLRNPAAGLMTHHAIKAPVTNALGENQIYLGPYASDAIASETEGLGLSDNSGIFKLGVLLPLDKLQAFSEGQVKAIRFGLCATVTDAAVFIYPVTSLQPLTLGQPLVEQTVPITQVGWNQVELANPITIDTDGIVGLMLGYQYKQVKGDTDASFPISVVDEGTILSTYTYGSVTSNQWQDIGLSTYGNLSVQAIVEKDYPEHNLYLSTPQANSYANVAQGLNFSVGLSNIGKQTLWNYTIDMLIDGVLMDLIDSPEALTPAEVLLSCNCPLDGVTPGKHTLTLRVATVAGQAVSDGPTVSAQFTAYTNSFQRQKQLVEQFTTQGASNCPKGDAVLEALQQMRDDMAWVAIHLNYNGTDEFNIPEGTQVTSYLGGNRYPSATFNRQGGIQSIGYSAQYVQQAANMLSYTYFDCNPMPALATVRSQGGIQSIGYSAQYVQQAANMLSYTYFDCNPMPALATVRINPVYNEATRNLDVKVSGRVVADWSSVLDSDIGLMVYLTEDSLVGKQLKSGVWVEDYVHNHVLRSVLTPFDGDPLTINGTAYEKTYHAVLASDWNPDNMRIVAFIHRLGTRVTGVQVVNCEASSLFDAVSGDINGDGLVDIADVNAVINMMLGKVAPTAAADVNGDGSVDIADVNAVINLMLGK